MDEDKYYHDKIRVILNGEVKILGDCPFPKIREPEGGLNLLKKGPMRSLIHYCGHPIMKGREEIECKYGLTEIRVPEKCPLREESLTITKTVEVLLNHEEANFG